MKNMIEDKIIVEAVFALMFRSIDVDLVTMTHEIRKIYKRNGIPDEDVRQGQVGEELVRRIFEETPLHF